MQSPPTLHYAPHRPWYRRKQFALVLILLLVSGMFMIGGHFASRKIRQHFHDRQARLDEALVVRSFKADASEVQRLLRAGANPNCRYGKEGDIAFRGKDGGWPMSAPNFTPLLALAYSDALSDRVPVAKLLIDAGANVNLNDGYGATALYEAVGNGRESLALYLLDHGASVNTRTGVYIDGPGDTTPLHRAVGSPRLISALAAKGADINARDTDGQTPLYLAVLFKDESTPAQAPIFPITTARPRSCWSSGPHKASCASNVAPATPAPHLQTPSPNRPRD